ncbi:MAG: hypothetical protein KGJ57_22170 [Sphingomonadales bacterium]|nr:hypothetical protein [Sphingomonadales bacterium]MDE2172094.1 hypothetical protein [Sphingomonadales bacterium]
MLERPEIPLYTNGSENDIRAFVTKRNISVGTVSERGRIARHTTLGVSFYRFLIDRFGIPGATSVQWLPDLVSVANA